MSFAQRRLWFLDRLEGLGSAYNVPLVARMRGVLDTAVLRSALADMVARHESLRTVLGETGGTPYQRVLAAGDATPELTVLDVADVAGTVAEVVRYEFDITAELPIRSWVLRVSAEESVVVVLVHHIAADEWSAAPLLRDLGDAYGARLAGREPDWAPLPVQYADYAMWQRELLGDGDRDSPLGTQVEFWREQLAGLPEVLPLPTDRARPAVPSHRGETVDVELDAAGYDALRKVADASGVTVFMVLQAGVAALLSRLGAGVDVPLGSPVAGRSDEALDEVVGFFVNTLVLRTDLSGDPSLGELLTRVRETNLAAYGYQDVPFERLVELLNPPRSLARHPLFQVMVLYQRRDAPLPGLPGLHSEPEPVEQGAAKFDLTFAFADDPRAGRLSASITYSTDLFDRATAESFAWRLRRLLEAWTAEPRTPLGELDLLTAAERGAVLSGWDGARTEVPATTLPSLVSAQAARSPWTTALVGDGVRLDYADLDARVEAMAGSLRTLGVGPDTIVAVAAPRSVELVVALLAVQRAGGAYLPLDPGHPAARNEYVLTDARPALLLTPSWARLDLVSPVPVHTFDAHGTVDGTGTGAAARAGRPAAPDDAAYVIYTSGSTGRPKGTVITHRAIVNRLLWMQDTFGLGEGEAVLQKTPSGFDVSVWEFFWPLLTGATLVLARPDGHREPRYLAKLIQDEHVSTVHFVPSMLRAFLDEPAARDCTGLRRVLCSGEALPRELAERALATLDAELHNLYGPTECAVDVTWTRVRSEPAAPVPIGRGVWNTACRVLDARLRPVPPAVPGELYVGGVQLARGYLGRAGLTAARFVAAEDGGRWYRTGDLARWRADGELEFLGRADDQVKIRGLRIELGEIESVLGTHPDVATAVAAVHENRIVAYVVARTGSDLGDAAGLREHAAAQLPDYMVPAIVVPLDELPLSPNGKLDRSRLPEPDFAALAGSREAAGPGERVLTTLFAELLRLPEVGADDSFFALGGDSILSLQLVSRARDAGLVITPRQVFERQTPAGLADVALAETAQPEAALVSEDGRLPLTPIMRWLLGRGGDARSFVQYRLLTTPDGVGKDDVVRLLGVLLDRHGALRSRLDGDELMVTPAHEVSVEPLLTVVDAAGPGDLAGRLDAAVEALDPGQGRMLSAVWFDAGPDASAERPGRLLLVVHHLAVDGVSWRILLDDLNRAWSDPDATPAASTSLRAWALGLAGRAESGEFASELALWRSVLEAPDPVLGARALTPADTMACVEHLTSAVPAETTRHLLTTVPRAFHAGVNDVLLTGLALAVADWRRARGRATGGVLVALEGHGREEHLLPGADLSRTVGWFTSLYPVWLDPGTGDHAHALKRVKETLRALPGNGSGFGALRHLTGELGDGGEPQLGFNYHGRVSAGARAQDGFAVAPESAELAPPVATGLPAPRVLDLNASTVDADDGPVLRVNWSWVHDLLGEDDVRELAERYTTALTGLVAHVVDGGAGGHTPSDVDLLDLDQDEIDDFEAEWGER
ncbi:non-ribosomal peptide synthetase [Prauserella cavernicola]|uniref:Amino acid adenylation domain-containing protein n=1 Tax=Prauserella cavernicola TaxID=2800127 RepID=A0A934QN60_9PSEU|nr:non-ribosomal peptide synthetase [Prauserella cavernicola]MBK1783696.1 amino acid adenylation domain-containing protein [Prauserella cavernicola]